jgi:hypothetical protein
LGFGVITAQANHEEALATVFRNGKDWITYPNENINRKGKPVPVQDDKTLFSYNHIVAMSVKLILHLQSGWAQSVRII